MPLILVETGRSYTIRRIAGSPETAHHLEEMGFVRGAETVLISMVNGNYIVSIKGARIGLGRELAKRIIVDID